MDRYGFKLPDIGEGIAEAEVVAWHVKVGDLVAEDDPLVDMMTDKATVELSSPKSGRVVSLAGAPGDKLRIGSEIAVLDLSGAEAAAPPLEAAAPKAAPPEPKAPPPEPKPAPKPEPEPETRKAPPPAPAQPAAPGQKPLASPSVRKRARELGIALPFVRGSGPAGRIDHADLDAFLIARDRAPGAPAPAAVAEDAVEEVPVIGLRRRIAERMQESKRRIPHYSYVEEADVTAVEALRAQLNADKSRPKLTLLPFVIRAVVRAVRLHPQVNAQYDDEAGILRRHRAVHLGIATQTPQGLLVPVLRHAETLDLWQAAAGVLRLAEAAREGRSARTDLSGSTITVTSLGPLGGLVHTPVINHPEVAIVGVNKMVERPVVRDGRIEVRTMMNISSSFDHRVVDGWDAARFIQDVRAGLENPALLFIGPAA